MNAAAELKARRLAAHVPRAGRPSSRCGARPWQAATAEHLGRSRHPPGAGAAVRFLFAAHPHLLAPVCRSSTGHCTSNKRDSNAPKPRGAPSRCSLCARGRTLNALRRTLLPTLPIGAGKAHAALPSLRTVRAVFPYTAFRARVSSLDWHAFALGPSSGCARAQRSRRWASVNGRGPHERDRRYHPVPGRPGAHSISPLPHAPLPQKT